jgi:protein gp37
MSNHTPIEWADATLNFWAGCTKVSPACDHCYAEKMSGRLWKVQWGPRQKRKFFLGAADSLVKLDRKAKREGTRPLVFINSLSDLFDNEVDNAFRMDAFKAMSLCTELTFLVLTKRIGNVERYLKRDSLAFDMVTSGRVWLGITVVNQEEVNRDVPKLLEVPAAVRFLSIEPMLAPISLRWLSAWPDRADGRHAENPSGTTNHLDGLRRLNWVICGAESGPGARPMHPDWPRSLRDQCGAAGVPFLFKQWGEWLPINQQTEEFTRRLYRSNRVAEPHEDQDALDDCHGRRCTTPYGVVHADGSFHEPLEPMAFLQGTGAMATFKVGKKVAGRLLDGVEHNSFPDLSKLRALA